MAPKKMAGMPLEDESDNESAFYEAENRNVALTTASFELRRRQVKEFKVFPEKDEKNHVKQCMEEMVQGCPRRAPEA